MHPLYTYIKRSLSPYYPELEAQTLAKSILTEVFGFQSSELYAGKDRNFSTNEHAKLEDILARLKRHEPYQYIVGEAFFHGLSFEVTPDVLIPRPETAELVDWIVSDFEGKDKGLHIIDIGTGSGCIAVSLAKMLPEALVSAWDVSAGALTVAKRNADRHNCIVECNYVNVLEEISSEVHADICVSNPPYICEKERQTLEQNVSEWEPGTALFVPDDDPLLFYREIAKKGHALLHAGGVIYFEINQAYGRETVELLSRMGYQEVELRKDIYGNDRMVKAVKP